MKKSFKAMLALGAMAFTFGAQTVMADDAKSPVTFGGFGRGMFGINGDSAGDTAVAAGAAYGNFDNIGLNVKADFGNAGFEIDLQADPEFINNVTYASVSADKMFGDNQMFWAKPFDNVKIKMGHFIDSDNGRDGLNFADYNWVRSSWTGDGGVFSGQGGKDSGWGGNQALDVTVNVVPGFNVFALAYNGGTTLTDTARSLNYGATYNITGIGSVRAQVFGDQQMNAAYQVVNAAFALSAVPGLWSDTGVFVPTDPTYDGYTFKVAETASYQLPDICTIAVNLFYQDNKVGDAGVEAGLAVSKTVEGYGLEAGIHYLSKTQNTDTTKDGYVAIVDVTKQVGALNVGLAFEYTTARWVEDITGSDWNKGTATTMGQWTIPLRLQYWF